jgi:lipoprotein-releasing system permease protein
MSFSWFIAVRYLTARRKQAFISLISLVSILGVGVGVMALVIANALMTGVQGEMRDRIVGATAHINVWKGGAGLLDVDAEVARMMRPGVLAAAPVVAGQGLLHSAGRSSFVQLKGIDPVREVAVTDLGVSMLSGSVDALQVVADPDPEVILPPDPILLGSALARSLNLRVGDDVQLMVPQGMITPMGIVPRQRLLRVVGIFELGFHEFDSNYGLLSLDVAQQLLNMPGPQAMQLRVARLDDAPEIAAELQGALGLDYTAQDWTVLNAPLYEALRLEKLAIGFTIGLIVMVAALNIVASLVLLVMEKSRDIGILRTMGAPASAIQRIFILQGVTIGAVGTFVGAALGVIVSWVCDRYQLFSLPGDVYQITHLRFRVETLDVVTIVVAAMLVCLVATIYPARRASGIDPAEALRYQ